MPELNMLDIPLCRKGSTWFVDDESLIGSAELFDARDILDIISADIIEVDPRFCLLLPDAEMLGWQMELHLERLNECGALYIDTWQGLEGYLPASVFRRFPEIPEWLYAKARELDSKNRKQRVLS